MPLDLAYFLLALERAAGHADGFKLASIALVESACQSSLSGACMFGWVVVLVTGQRLYLEAEVVNAEGNLEITPLPEHQRYPDELENAVTWYRPDHINRHFGLNRSFAP